MTEPNPERRRFPVVRVVVIAIVAVILYMAIAHAVDPYDDRGIVAIPHGDHNHYVPRDRDPEVPISNFPTIPPGPDERLTPDGRIVPLNP